MTEHVNSVHAKLATARRMVGQVEMRAAVGQAADDAEGFDFAPARDVFRVVRDQLDRRGLLAASDVVGVERRDPSPQPAGSVHSPTTLTTVRLSISITDKTTGDSIAHRWVGESDDTAGRGVAKAITQGLKTFWLATLMVPTVDAEASSEDRRRDKVRENPPVTHAQITGFILPAREKAERRGLDDKLYKALIRETCGGVEHVERIRRRDAEKLVRALEAWEPLK